MSRIRPPGSADQVVDLIMAAVRLATALSRRWWRHRLLRPASMLLAGVSVLSSLVGVTHAAFSGTTANPANTAAAAAFPRCYGDAVLADSPASYWRLDETSGTSAADSAGANSGTYRNGTTVGKAGALTEAANKAASFDGSNDDVEVADVYDFPGTASFSVDWWLKRTTVNDNTWRALVMKTDYGSGSSREGWETWLSSESDPNPSLRNRISVERWRGTTQHKFLGGPGSRPGSGITWRSPMTAPRCAFMSTASLTARWPRPCP